jgi:hypothetical protein
MIISRSLLGGLCIVVLSVLVLGFTYPLMHTVGQQPVTKVRGQEAGNAGDTNPFTFMFSKENEPRQLKKLDGTAISLEEVARLYGKEDGMRITADGEDVVNKYNLRPKGVRLINENGDWLDVKVAPDALPIDPETGSFLLRTPQLTDIKDKGGLAKPLPSGGTGLDIAGNYIYITDEKTGLHIIDLSTREEVGSYPIYGITNGVTVEGRYAYLSEESPTPALHIVDISNPKQPFLIPNGKVPFSLGIPLKSIVKGDYVYVAVSEGGLQIIKIHDDNDPQIVKPHIVASYIPQGGKVRDFDIVDNYAYVVDRLEGFHVLDISIPEQPKLVRKVGNIGQVYRIAVRGKHAYVLALEHGLRIVDMDTFRPVGSMKTVLSPQNLALIGNFVFITDYGLGGVIVLVDVSDPNKPKAAQFPNNRTGVVPAGTKPFAIRIVDDYIYIANYAPKGLRVFQAIFNFNPALGRVQVDYNY